MSRDLLETIVGRVATLTFNRPERRNALSPDIVNGLLEALPRLGTDPAIGAIVVTGAGQTFCAGGDVKAMADNPDRYDQAEAVQHMRGRVEIARLLHDVGKPTIAALNGAAAGAGFSVALACDLRIAGQSARLVTAFARIGLSGDYGGSYFLSKLIGTSRARELYYTGATMDANEAFALGLVNKVVPDAELVGATAALAAAIANGPTVAIGMMKQNFNAAETSTLEQVMSLEAVNQVLSGKTEDHREGVRAFVEKRRPNFKGQ